MTLRERLRAHCNDYSNLEEAWRRSTGSELVSDPFQALKATCAAHDRTPPLVSVVVPCWNARDTLAACLRGIEASTFNRKYPDRLEVIAVDDGSTDDTWSHLRELTVDLRVIALRQEHHGRAQAMNAGIAITAGDVIISCDADMILTAGAIEELVRRQLLFPEAVLVGFRSNHPGGDLVTCEALVHSIPRFFDDNRFIYDWPGWPDNMMAATKALKELGSERKLWVTDNVTPSDEIWTLHRMVYGALFSMGRERWWTIGGYDERFCGWGWEDTAVGARAIAAGSHVIPVPSATGYHLVHAERSPTQWQEAVRNKRRLEALLDNPEAARPNGLESAASRIRERVSLRRVPRPPSHPQSHLRAAAAYLTPPCRRGFYHFMLGHYDRAAEAYAAADSIDAVNLARHARCCYELGATEMADEILRRALETEGAKPSLVVECMWAHARRGNVAASRRVLSNAGGCATRHPVLAYLRRHHSESHCARGELYLAQGTARIAWRDFAAALIGTPGLRRARAGLERSLMALNG